MTKNMVKIICFGEHKFNFKNMCLSKTTEILMNYVDLEHNGIHCQSWN